MSLVTDNITTTSDINFLDRLDLFQLKDTIRLTLTLNNILLCVRLIGIVLNIIALLVWTSKEMKSVTSTYLISIVCFDLVYLVSYVVSNIMIICNVCLVKPTLWVTDLVMMGAINFGLCGSILTTVAVSFERYIAIAYPFKVRFICTTRVACIMAGLIFCVITAYVTLDSVHALDMYIPLPPTLGLKDVMNADNATITALGEYPLILFSCVYFNAKDVLNDDFPLSHNILVYIIPSCLLFIINILIVKNLRTAQSITSSRNPAAELAKRRLIKSVVAISCMSLTAYPTSFLMFFISQYHVTSEASQFSMMMFIEDMVHALNSSINCLLYCLIGKRFRSVFMKLLCAGCRRRQSRPQRAPVYVISSNDKSSSTRH